MNCKLAEANVDAYIDGELSATAAEEMQRHLESCSGCAQLYHRSRQIGASLIRRQAPAYLKGEVRTGMSAAAPPRRRSLRVALICAVALAATVSVTVLRPQPAQAAPAWSKVEKAISGVSSAFVVTRYRHTEGITGLQIHFKLKTREDQGQGGLAMGPWGQPIWDWDAPPTPWKSEQFVKSILNASVAPQSPTGAGVARIDGREVQTFLIPSLGNDSSAPNRRWRVFVDPASSLPVRCDLEEFEQDVNDWEIVSQSYLFFNVTFDKTKEMSQGIEERYGAGKPWSPW